jgi:hypothetical protein
MKGIRGQGREEKREGVIGGVRSEGMMTKEREEDMQ